jgi:ribosomal protein S20
MAPRAGVVSVDVEPNLSQVGSKLQAMASTLKPLGIKVDDRFVQQIDRGAKSSQRSLDGISTTKAQGQLTALGTVGNTELGRIGGTAKLTGQQLVGLGAGGVFVGTKILGSLKPATDAASDLNEVVSYSGQVFGAASAQIEQFADGAADSLGQSKRQAIEGANTFGTFGKAAGLAGSDLTGFSTKLVTLASDLASAKNTSPEDAITALGAALRGETEPIRNYGVLLDDASVRQEALALGLVKTTKDALTPQNKVLAVNSLLYKQTADAQGDFVRTADSAANSAKTVAANMENAKADAGSGLLGVLSATNEAASTVLTYLDKIPHATQALGIGLGVVGGGVILGGTVSAIAGGIRSLQEMRTAASATQNSLSSVGSVGVTSFGSLGKAMTAAGAVLAAIGFAESVGAIANELRGLDGASKEAMDFFVANIDEGSLAAVTSLDALAAVADSSSSISDAIKAVGTEFSFAGLTEARDIENFQTAFDQISAARPVAEVQKFITAARAQNERLDHSTVAYKETNKLLDKWQETVGTATEAQKKQAAATDEQTEALDRFGNKVDETKGKFEQAAESDAQLASPFDEAIDAYDQLLDARQEEIDAQAEVDRLRKGAVPGSKEAIELAEKIADAEQSVAEALRSEASARRDLTDANRDLADLQAELAHVNPERDPNRFRELSEKVRDAQDAQLDAQDRVASAAEATRQATGDLSDTRAEGAGDADELAAAEERLRTAQEGSQTAAQNWTTALAVLRDEIDAHPEIVQAMNDKIDEYVAKGLLAKDAADQWKASLEGVAAAAAALPDPGTTVPTDFPWSPVPIPKVDPGPGKPKDGEKRIHTLNVEQAIGDGLMFMGDLPFLVDKTVKTHKGHRWTWHRDEGVWRAFYHQGGLVDEQPDENGEVRARLLPKEFVVNPVATQRFRTDLEAMNAGTYTVADNSTVTSSTTTQSTGTAESPMLAELRAMRASIENLQNITYAPQITAMPADVGPTMDEALRASRRHAWPSHGRQVPRG